MYPGLNRCSSRGPDHQSVGSLVSVKRIVSSPRGSSSYCNMAAGALRKLMVDEAKVAPAIAKFMAETLHMESVSDWFSFFKADEYEDGVQRDILDHIPEFKQDRIQRGRLRTAWTLARSAMKRHEIRDTAAGDDDGEIEAPLKEGLKESADKSFKAAYGGIAFAPEAQPADALYNRLFREFKKKQVSVYPLDKVRSNAQQSVILENTKASHKVSENISITYNAAPDVPIRFNSTIQVLQALKVLTNGWAMVGTAEVTSKVDGGKTRDADLSLCMQYHEFVTRRAMAYNSAPVKLVPWVCDRHRQTVIKAKALHTEQGWPWAEAVIKATETSTAVLWTCGPGTSGVSPVMPGAEEYPRGGGDRGRGEDRRSDRGRRDYRSRSRRRQDRKGKGKGRYNSPPKSQPPYKGSGSGSDLCEDFNDNRCTAKQRDCPKRKKHACNYRIPGRGLCMAWNHCKKFCPNNPDRQFGKRNR